MSAAAGLFALVLTLADFDVSVQLQQLVWAGVGLAFVSLGNVWRVFPASHFAAIGHIISTASLFYLAVGGDPASVVVAWALGWVTSAMADEVGGDTFTSLISRFVHVDTDSQTDDVETPVRYLVPITLVVSIPAAVISLAAYWVDFADNRSVVGAIIASVAILFAVVGRTGQLSNPLRQTLRQGALVSTVVGVFAAGVDPWPSLYSASSAIGVGMIVGPEMRRPWFLWFTWLMTVVVVIRAAELAGLSGDSLHLPALAWGAIMLLGGLSYDDIRSGRRQPGVGLRTPWLRPPVVIGSILVPVGLALAVAANPNSYGWWALGAGVGYLALATLSRIGLISGLAYLLIAVGVTATSPWSLVDDPWLFVWLAAPLLAISWVSEKWQTAGESALLRWDLPPLVVAHAIAGVALAVAWQSGGLSSTALRSDCFRCWSGFGVDNACGPRSETS